MTQNIEKTATVLVDSLIELAKKDVLKFNVNRVWLLFNYVLPRTCDVSSQIVVVRDLLQKLLVGHSPVTISYKFGLLILEISNIILLGSIYSCGAQPVSHASCVVQRGSVRNGA